MFCMETTCVLLSKQGNMSVLKQALKQQCRVDNVNSTERHDTERGALEHGIIYQQPLVQIVNCLERAAGSLMQMSQR